MLLECTSVKQLVADECLAHMETGAHNWYLPSPLRPDTATSCRLVGTAANGTAIVVLETLRDGLVTSEIHLVHLDIAGATDVASVASVTQESIPIFKITSSAIVYHCAIPDESPYAMIVTFTYVRSPFTADTAATDTDRLKRLFDVLLVFLPLQCCSADGEWPVFNDTEKVEQLMQLYGMRHLVTESQEPVVGYFLTRKAQHNWSKRDGQSSPGTFTTNILFIDNIAIQMHRLILIYFLMSSAPGVVAEEYTLPLTYCVCRPTQGSTLQSATIDKINVRFGQCLNEELRPFVKWHKIDRINTISSHTGETVAFRHFLPATGDLVVITKQKAGTYMDIDTVNLTVSIYKESHGHARLNLSSSNTSTASTVISSPLTAASPAQTEVLSCHQILLHVCSMCIGAFPDGLLLPAESHNAAIPGTLSVSFGSIYSSLLIVAIEYFPPLASSIDTPTSSGSTTKAMLTLVSPFTATVYTTSTHLSIDMAGLRIAGRSEDSIDPGIKKTVDATSFRLFSNSISTYVLSNTKLDCADDASHINPLAFRTLVRNSYRHSFLAVCSTQVFFTAGLVFWCVPDPKANTLNVTLIACNQLGGFHTVLAAPDTLLSVDLHHLFQHGKVAKFHGKGGLRSDSVFDILGSRTGKDKRGFLHYPAISSNTLQPHPRDTICDIKEYEVSKTLFKAKQRAFTQSSTASMQPKSSQEAVGTTVLQLSRSQLGNSTTDVSDICTVTGLFSELTHLVPVPAIKMAYSLILKELNLHRSNTMLGHSSKRFVQLQLGTLGGLTCRCRQLVSHNKNQAQASVSSSVCKAVLDNFQTIYVYDTYHCRICAITINYSSILDYLFSGKHRDAVKAVLVRNSLLTTACRAQTAVFPHLEGSEHSDTFHNMSPYLGRRLDRLLLHTVMSVRVSAFFYHLGTLALNYGGCRAHPYLVLNILRSLVGKKENEGDYADADPSNNEVDREDKTLFKNAFAIIMQCFTECAFLTNRTVFCLPGTESPLALFSLLYCKAMHEIYSCSGLCGLPGALAAHALASGYYRKFMYQRLLTFESFKQFYKALQLPCTQLETQCSFLRSISQFDEMGMQLSDMLMRSGTNMFQPRILFLGKMNQGIIYHPLCREVLVSSELSISLLDHYIYHRPSLQGFPQQICYLSAHSPVTAASGDGLLSTMELDTFAQQVTTSLARLQASICEEIPAVLTMYQQTWMLLLEIQETFMGATYSSSESRYRGTHPELLAIVHNAFENVSVHMPCRPTWITSMHKAPQFIYPCYRHTSNYIKAPVASDRWRNKSSRLNRPLSSVLLLLCEHALLKHMLTCGECPMSTSLIDAGKSDSAKPLGTLTRPSSRVRSRSRLQGQKQHPPQQAQRPSMHGSRLDLGDLREPPLRHNPALMMVGLVGPIQHRMSQIEETLDQPLADVFNEVLVEALNFELLYGLEPPETLHTKLSQPVRPQSHVTRPNRGTETAPSLSSTPSRLSMRAGSRLGQRKSATDKLTRSQLFEQPHSPKAAEIDDISIGTYAQPKLVDSHKQAAIHEIAQQPDPRLHVCIKNASECPGLDSTDISSFLAYL